MLKEVVSSSGESASHISRGLLTQIVAATTGWRNTDLCHHRGKFKGSRLSHTDSSSRKFV